MTIIFGKISFRPATLKKVKELRAISEKTKNHSAYQSIIDKDSETIYISGKITGENFDFCRDKFRRAEEYLKTTFPFATVINPFEEIIKEFGIDAEIKWELAMRYVLNLMLTRSQVIYFLKDWSLSSGARLEHTISSELKFESIYQ